MSEKISITRALAELKLLDSRIEKKINESEFVHFVSKKKAVNIDMLNRLSKGNFQSIMDLLDRRSKLKNAIILSNAKTMVKLCDKQLTVAEVIEKKQIIPMYKSLLQKLRTNRDSVNYQVDRSTSQLENDLQKILEINFGKSNNLKTNSDDIETISKTYRENNKCDMLDCIDINNKIKEIEEFIEQYETESNFVLSESNAITLIEV